MSLFYYIFVNLPKKRFFEAWQIAPETPCVLYIHRAMMRKSHFCILTKQLKACGRKSKLQENLENELQVYKEETGISRKQKIM